MSQLLLEIALPAWICGFSCALVIVAYVARRAQEEDSAWWLELCEAE